MGVCHNSEENQISESMIWFLNFAFNLTDVDLYNRRAVGRELLEAAGVRRGESIFCAQVIGRTPTATRDYSGLIIPYTLPDKPLWEPRAYRIRRDNPDIVIEKGKRREKGKYLSSVGMKNMFYFAPGTTEAMLRDTSLPKVFCEGEFKTLALMRAARETSINGRLPFLPIGIQGIYGWLSKYADASEPIRDHDRITWSGLRVVMFRDSNVLDPEKAQVEKGWRRFARHTEWCGSEVFETEAPLEPGINGPDDLIARDGVMAAIERIENAAPARKYRSPIRKSTPEEIKERAKKIRKLISPEEKASAVIGARETKALASLMAECNLSAGSRDLLFVLHAMAETDGNGSEIEFTYKELYTLLFKREGAFDDVGNLKSSARAKIRERFDKLEAEQALCRVTFAYLTPGHKDQDGNLIPSLVRLYGRQHIAEIEATAEEDSGFPRHRQASRERATIAWVKKQAGAAYIEKPPKKKTPNQRISDGLARVKGNLDATIKHMRERGDSETNIWLSICEIVPPDFLAFLAENTDLINKRIQISFESDPIVEDDDFPHTEDELSSPVETSKILTLGQGINQSDSTDNSAQNPNFVQPSQPSDIELWEKVCERTQQAEEKKVTEMEAAREAAISEPLSEPIEWENSHTDASPPDEFDLPELKCRCGAPLEAYAERCKSGCLYSPFYWRSDWILRDLGLIKDVIWHSKDFEYTVAIKLPAVPADDGRRYVAIEGADSRIPVDEVEIVGGGAT